MFLSHHPPCQYDRTFRIGRHRYCVRCSGVLIGMLLWGFMSPEQEWVSWAMAGLSPVPAVVHFLLNETRKVENHNGLRFFTGILLGGNPGVFLVALLAGAWWLVGFSLATLFIYQLVTLAILKRTQRLEAFFEAYDLGVWAMEESG